MNIINTEALAIAKIIRVVSRSNILDATHIKSGDKEPSWDGNIYLYTNPQKKNDGNLRKVPVQVKGTKSQLFDKSGRYKYRIERAHINMPDDNPYKYEIIQWLCLGILKASDKCDVNRKDVLSLAQSLIEWEIATYGERAISTLNLFQIYKRSRALTASERQKLFDIVNSKEEDACKAAACLLLDNQEQAEYHFNKLPPETKEAFTKWPIYYFWTASVKNT